MDHPAGPAEHQDAQGRGGGDEGDSEGGGTQRDLSVGMDGGDEGLALGPTDSIPLASLPISLLMHHDSRTRRKGNAL